MTETHEHKRLTEYADCAGWAGKLPQGQLAQVLRDVLGEPDARLVVGPQSLDDAGVIELGEGDGLPAGTRLGLVQTVDFFPPVVDDPYLYGAVAAANSLSDVYAMGGRPVAALTIASFPKGFPRELQTEIFRGGFDKVRESGSALAGGHTVESDLQFGFAVTGIAPASGAISNAGARAGDRIYLTKALGMGAITTGGKRGAAEPELVLRAAQQMAELNDRAAAAMLAADAHACTDVTGFGLMGHAANVARASGVRLRFDSAALPIFAGSLELARLGVLSGGSARSRKALAERVAVAASVEAALAALVFDAETSGGLLIFVAAARAADLERELSARGVAGHAIGEVLAPGDSAVEIELV